MATTSLSLSPQWAAFIEGEVRSGRYSSASEVVRAGLRELEEKGRRLDLLRAHLQAGAEQAAAGQFVGSDIATIMAHAKSGT